ncbi:MAG: hypothetical protein IH945_11100 [Armatimonadetes bacterium]|nr:hypothetical protein [Armatimonadota bacterium]
MRAIALAAMVATVASPLAGPPDDKALKALLNALEAQRDVKVTLIQRRSYGRETITVKVQIVPRRGIRATILQPPIYAGVVSFDDGVLWRNYDPGTNTVRIEKSPAKFHLDVRFRGKAIRKNYDVTFENDSQVAGRATIVVLMKGKVNGVSDRRLFIDAKNNLILRYIVYNAGKKPLTTVDTLSVDFSNQPNEAYLDRIGSKGAKEVKSWGPRELQTPQDALQFVDFEPKVPEALPAGLQLQAIHMVGTEPRPFIGVRLTDGMAVVTVYLWRKGMEGEPFGGLGHAESADGIRCLVQGDVASSFKRRIARLFIEWYLGPLNDAGTIPILHGVPIIRSEHRASLVGNGLKW